MIKGRFYIPVIFVFRTNIRDEEILYQKLVSDKVFIPINSQSYNQLNFFETIFLKIQMKIFYKNQMSKNGLSSVIIFTDEEIKTDLPIKTF